MEDVYSVLSDDNGGVWIVDGTELPDTLNPLDIQPEVSSYLVGVQYFTIAGLQLFDEGKPDFDWDRDCDRLAHILMWLLEDIGMSPTDQRKFNRVIRTVCQPGPPLQPVDRMVQITHG
jgi:hypothetical protein